MYWLTVPAGIAAVMWGTSDFAAGLLARRLPVTTILFWSKVAGLALALLVLVIRGAPPAFDSRMWLAVAGGLAGLPAMGLLYRAMRDGSPAVVAPIAAVATLVPVGWGLLHGEHFGAVGMLGVLVALIGVTLAGWPVEAVRGRVAPAGPAAMLSALGAAIGFGAYFVLLHEASGSDPLGAVAVARIAEGLGVLVLLRRVRASPIRAVPSRVATMCTVGALDAVADGAFVYAASAGPLGAATMLASMYPAVTVLLNRTVLRERMHAVHLCGVLATLFAVACLAG